MKETLEGAVLLFGGVTVYLGAITIGAYATGEGHWSLWIALATGAVPAIYFGIRLIRYKKGE